MAQMNVIPHAGGSFVSGFAGGLDRMMMAKLARQMALIQSGDLGMIDKPVQPVGQYDPRRAMPGYAHAPDVAEEAMMAPGPGGSWVGGTPAAGGGWGEGAEMRPTGRMLPADLGTYRGIGPIENLARKYKGAQIAELEAKPGQRATELDQWKLSFARKYAEGLAGEMGALADPEAYDEAFNKGWMMAEVMSDSGMDLKGMTELLGGGAGEEDIGAVGAEDLGGGMGGGPLTPQEIHENVQYLDSLPPEERQTILDDPRLEPVIKEAYFKFKFPGMSGRMGPVETPAAGGGGGMRDVLMQLMQSGMGGGGSAAMPGAGGGGMFPPGALR